MLYIFVVTNWKFLSLCSLSLCLVGSTMENREFCGLNVLLIVEWILCQGHVWMSAVNVFEPIKIITFFTLVRNFCSTQYWAAFRYICITLSTIQYFNTYHTKHITKVAQNVYNQSYRSMNFLFLENTLPNPAQSLQTLSSLFFGKTFIKVDSEFSVNIKLYV